MRLPKALERILDKAMDGQAPSKEECVALLRLPEDSLEAACLKAAADVAARRRFRNEGILLGQIGIETSPCPGNCGFCVFGKDHTTLPASRLPIPEVVGRARGFADEGDLYALFLMAMHDYDADRLLEVVDAVRRAIPEHTQIVVNIGDFDLPMAQRLRQAGVRGAYHVCRLGEGTDTALSPEARRETFGAIRDAGLDLYYCCEPIGPEHTAEELVEQLFVGIEFGCFQHAAMRRVRLPGVPLARHGQITERRLAQVVAVVTLASLGCAGTQSIAVHEPNLLGLVAGANTVYAETGANPRDVARDTAGNRGADMAACRKMLYEAGFAALRRGDGTVLDLGGASLPQAG